MQHRFGRLATACTIVAVALLAGQGTSGSAGLSLKGAAGRYNTATFQPLGNAKDAQASWTNKTALAGKFSMQLTKVTDDQYAYAAAIVKGVEGMTASQLGPMGFAFKGTCNGGSPRFNLYYDNNGDGGWDGYTFYGCNNVTPTDSGGGWSTVSFDPLAPPFTVYDAIGPNSKVVQLSVLIDIVGSVNIDNVTAGGSTVGEP
jgi:hypothetical protein